MLGDGGSSTGSRPALRRQWRRRDTPSRGSETVRAQALIERFGPMVFRRACMILRDKDEAKDVMQEVFMTVLRAAPDIEDQASSWLYRVTTNACLNRLRATRRYAALQLRSRELPNSDAAGIGFEDSRVVRELLAAADPTCAAAAVYVFVEGMSHDQAAELLGVSRRTVGNLLERFVSWAQARLADHSECLAATGTEEGKS